MIEGTLREGKFIWSSGKTRYNKKEKSSRFLPFFRLTRDKYHLGPVQLFLNNQLPLTWTFTVPNKCSLYTTSTWIFRILKITQPKYFAKILIKSVAKITIVRGSLFYRVLQNEKYFHGFCTNSVGFIQVHFIQNYEIASKATLSSSSIRDQKYCTYINYWDISILNVSNWREHRTLETSLKRQEKTHEDKQVKELQPFASE